MANPYTDAGSFNQGGAANPSGAAGWYNPSGGAPSGAPAYALPHDTVPNPDVQPQWSAAAPPADQPQWVDPAGGPANPGIVSQPPDLVTAKFWTIEFYQQFFDVDTKDVLKRMGNVLLPCVAPDFLHDRHWHMGNLPGGVMPGALSSAAAAFSSGVEKRADLYGPLWISTTLWVTLAIVGNIMGKMAYLRRAAQRDQEITNIIAHTPTLASGATHPPLWTPAPMQPWTYDFTAASAAAAAVYAFIVFMSFLVWGLMKWKSVPVGLTDALCLYGYSMFIFLLAAILCAVPVKPFQWLVCVLAAVWSCAYLLLNMWQLWKVSLEKPWFVGLVCLVLGSQFALTIGFKLYFFDYQF